MDPLLGAQGFGDEGNFQRASDALRSVNFCGFRFTFSLKTKRSVSQSKSRETGDRNSNYVLTIKRAIQNEDWGSVRKLGNKDVRNAGRTTY
jgi:hypothetical protein